MALQLTVLERVCVVGETPACVSPPALELHGGFSQDRLLPPLLAVPSAGARTPLLGQKEPRMRRVTSVPGPCPDPVAPARPLSALGGARAPLVGARSPARPARAGSGSWRVGAAPRPGAAVPVAAPAASQPGTRSVPSVTWPRGSAEGWASAGAAAALGLGRDETFHSWKTAELGSLLSPDRCSELGVAPDCGAHPCGQEVRGHPSRHLRCERRERRSAGGNRPGEGE